MLLDEDEEMIHEQEMQVSRQYMSNIYTILDHRASR